MSQKTTITTRLNMMSDSRTDSTAEIDHARRKQMRFIATSAVAAVALTHWGKPIVNSIILPAHAQTSCTTDSTVGGPLAGNASGATSCQAACEAEAADQSAQLCRVEETVDSMSAVQCSCELDLPD